MAELEAVRWLAVIAGIAVSCVKDLQVKEISLPATICCGLCGILLRVAGGFACKDFFLALIPGMIGVGLAAVTKEQTGYGDAWVLLAAGCCMRAQELWTAISLAMTGLGLVALFLCVVLRKNGSYEIPFVPFLFAGILCTWGMGI